MGWRALSGFTFVETEVLALPGPTRGVQPGFAWIFNGTNITTNGPSIAAFFNAAGWPAFALVILSSLIVDPLRQFQPAP
jgi:hypothetical protein